MGLFAYLKNKFSGKKDEKEEAKTEKYSEGLSKSRAAFADRLQELSKRYSEVNEAYFEELEQILIEADVGVPLTLKLVETLLNKSKSEGIKEPSKINELLVDEMFVSYVEGGGNIKNEVQFVTPGPTVLLVEGVNGVGKTTSIAKLAYRYQKQGKSVLLVASDTFRAGAVEQLQVWADRLHCPIVKGAPNGDPAAVAYDGAQYAKEHAIDLMIVDTAGRLQTKSNLMAELGKIKRVISKEIPNAPHETFLIIDATTGQNGVTQAEAFKEVSDVTGIVITKMDGTSKGGIILSIRDELGVPVRFIGLGEKMDDLEEFDLDEYLHGLLLGDQA
jgi:fused signal recognition particle receptor